MPTRDPQTFGITEVSDNFAFFQAPTREETCSIRNQYKLASLSTCEPVLPPPSAMLTNPSRMGSSSTGTSAYSSGPTGSYSSGPTSSHSSGPTASSPSSGPTGSSYSGPASSSSYSGPTSSHSSGTPALFTSPPPRTMARPKTRIPLFPHPALLMILFSLGICLPPPRTENFCHFLLPRRGSGHVLGYDTTRGTPHPSSVAKLLQRNPRNILLWLSQLQCLQSSGDLDPLAADDPHSLSLQLLFPCETCRKRMMGCLDCKSKNSPLSETLK